LSRLIRNSPHPTIFNLGRTKGSQLPGKKSLKEIKVVTYSGYKANERPLRLRIDEKDLEVVQVIDRWYGVDHDYFKCLASDGQVYMLKWHRTHDQWFLLPGPN
jgi:hypothetical protein